MGFAVISVSYIVWRRRIFLKRGGHVNVLSFCRELNLENITILIYGCHLQSEHRYQNG
jgi:hypothetical protein